MAKVKTTWLKKKNGTNCGILSYKVHYRSNLSNALFTLLCTYTG